MVNNLGCKQLSNAKRCVTQAVTWDNYKMPQSLVFTLFLSLLFDSIDCLLIFNTFFVVIFSLAVYFFICVLSILLCEARPAACLNESFYTNNVELS